MQKHHGEIVERVIRNNGFSITALAKGLNVNRRSLYNWFQSESLKSDSILSIGLIIGHNFSAEFPELFTTDDFTGDPTSVDTESESRDNEMYKGKYLKLLEDYNELLIDAIEQSETEELK